MAARRTAARYDRRTWCHGHDLLSRGCWYSVTILAILGRHELGHYFACRYYDVDASLPFFLPLPFRLTGTLGAFIRIREPIPTKRMLFDIGIAGPIAGFLVRSPRCSSASRCRTSSALLRDTGSELGEPLLFKLGAWMMWGTLPDGYSLNMHPMAFAAWFGLLATALNLFPIGQLDGGHISYAVLGPPIDLRHVLHGHRRRRPCLFSTNWIVWTG